MTKKGGFLSDEEEWPDQSAAPVVRERGEEAEFKRTGNYAYVALAIGDWASWKSFPTSPPPPRWAIEACLALREKVSFSKRPVIGTRTGSPGYDEDDHLLEMIADIMLNKHVSKRLGIRHSVRAATRWVLGLSETDEDDANYRRLRNHWAKEEGHRLKRAAARTHERLKKQGLLPGVKGMKSLDI